MTTRLGSSVMIALLAVAVSISACQAPATSSSGSDANSDNGSDGGSGGTFSASDLNGDWQSGCYSFSGNVPTETYYQNTLTLSGGDTWNMQQYTYTSSACNAAYYANLYTTGGTFTVGGIASGSMQYITFTATSSDSTSLDPLETLDTGTTDMATWWTDHTTGGSGFTDGEYAGLWNVTVNGGGTFYPNADGNDTIYNVATWSSGSLSMGAGVETVPGVYSSGSIPTSVTINYGPY